MLYKLNIMPLTYQPNDPNLAERDRPVIELTHQMIEAGASRLGDTEGSSSTYQAVEVFEAMAEAGGLLIRVVGR
jgi:replication fork clamp-binding protein CrfC